MHKAHKNVLAIFYTVEVWNKRDKMTRVVEHKNYRLKEDREFTKVY